jgi:hypothetical protein
MTGGSRVIYPPSWYFPPKINRPEVCAALFPAITMSCPPGVGPDVDADKKAHGGGSVYGGGYVKGQPGWKLTDDGYWINWAKSEPQHFTRMDQHPRVLKWDTVEGSLPGHEWLCPILLTCTKTKRGQLVFGTALEPVLGRKGWADCEDLADMQARMFKVAHGLRPITPASTDELVNLVFDILSLGHHGMTLNDLKAVGWISARFLFRVLLTAAGFPQEPDRDDHAQ